MVRSAWIIGQLLSLCLAFAAVSACSAEQNQHAVALMKTAPNPKVPAMKIRLIINDQTLSATLEDSVPAREFAAQLPITLQLEDYAATEKIAQLPHRLNIAGEPDGITPAAGDIAFYAPWGNLAIFHRPFGYSKGLVLLGRIEGGLQALRTAGPVEARIEFEWPSGRIPLHTTAAAGVEPRAQSAYHAQPAGQRRVLTSGAHEGAAMNIKYNGVSATELDSRQQAIIPLSASAAAGDMTGLRQWLNQGLDAGLSVVEVREVLVQVYAYAGFPRSLNALSELMKVAQARRQRGIQDEAGREPGRPIPKGDALLAAGTANQTRLAGGPVSGPLFDFAPQANEYLRTHLFGDIFERDNLDWQSRELATVSMLAALSGVEPQLQSHIGISMNIGLRPEQLYGLAAVLEARFGLEAAERVRVSIHRQLEARHE